jgi:phospholipase/lecithinase/hemolysin
MSGTNGPTAIYSFGDSLSDAGDANLLSMSAYAVAISFPQIVTHPPYYQESYAAEGGGSLLANVSSNGPVWVQDLASSLGIAAPAPGQVGATASVLTAAMQEEGVSDGAISSFIGTLEAQQGTTGSDPYLLLVDGAADPADFAIGGSVSGLTDFNIGGTVELGDLAAQVANFQADVTTPVAGALYTVWSGTNDVLNLWESPDVQGFITSGAAATDMAQSASAEVAAVLTLVAGGAGTVLVLNAPDIGTMPGALATGTADAAIASNLARMFDGDLATDLAATNFGAASVKLVDTFSLFDNMVADPQAYGLSDVTDQVYSASGGAFQSGDLVSADPDVQNTYLSFDGIHPTSTGQHAIAALADAALACFTAGTRILTPAGEVAVEALQEGMEVITLSGRRVPVRWLGHRHIDCRSRGAWPVRVRAGAFGRDVPHGDLLLSPDHAVFLAGDGEGAAPGVLIPIRDLINGVTIAQEPVDRVTYWHVELPEHDVLLAQGLPAESYLDTGNRGAFANGGGAMATRLDFSRRVGQAKGGAPLVVDGPVLARQQARTSVTDGAPRNPASSGPTARRHSRRGRDG